MERYHPLNRKEMDKLLRDGGFTSMFNMSLEHTVKPGDKIVVLNSYGESKLWEVTDKRPWDLDLAAKGIDCTEVVAQNSEREKFVLGTSMSDCYDVGWKFLDESKATSQV